MRRAIADWLRAVALWIDPRPRWKLSFVGDEPEATPTPAPQPDKPEAVPGSSLCTARRCTIQPYHSPCAHQTALADRREARRKAKVKAARKTARKAKG